MLLASRPNSSTLKLMCLGLPVIYCWCFNLPDYGYYLSGVNLLFALWFSRIEVIWLYLPDECWFRLTPAARFSMPAVAAIYLDGLPLSGFLAVNICWDSGLLLCLMALLFILSLLCLLVLSNSLDKRFVFGLYINF